MPLKEKFLFISLKDDNYDILNFKTRYKIHSSNSSPEDVYKEFNKFVAGGLKGEISRFYQIADLEFINDNNLRKVIDHSSGLHVSIFVKKYLNHIKVAKNVYMIFPLESSDQYKEDVFYQIGNLIGFKNCLYGTRGGRDYILTEGLFPLYEIFKGFDDLLIIHDYLSLYEMKKSL